MKSIRDGQASIQEDSVAFEGKNCIYGMHVSEYFRLVITTIFLEEENLLHRKELKQLQRKVKEQDIPLFHLNFATERNLIKAEIALVQGKKQFDKRQTIQQKMLKGKDRAKKESNRRN